MSDNQECYSKDDLLFIPLGGAGEIGSNVNLYHYKDQWLMIDCGSGFADDDMPGVDMLAPDVNFLQGKVLSAIIITHSHEDHLGGIPYVMQKLRYVSEFGDSYQYPPIYASQFAAVFLKEKLAGFGMQDKFDIRIINSDSEIDLGDIKCSFIQMTHSAAEMLSVVLSTDQGEILHTADWKFDMSPPSLRSDTEGGVGAPYGEKSEISKLEALGKKNVLAMISDSTNIFTEGTSESESSVYEDMHKIASEEKGMIVVPLFASNVFRIATLCKVARDTNRKIAYTGRSLNRIIKVAKACGYFQDCEILPDSEIEDMNRGNILLLCTGCQGEVLAATAKLADGSHRTTSLMEGDCVVFSSKIIPGNEKRIFALYNKFACSGIRLYTEQTHNVHVSGHPNRDDVKKMYDIIKPKISIPVHGSHLHLFEHVKFAKEVCNTPHAIKVYDGDIIKLSPETGPSKVGSVEVTFYGVDGKMLYQSQNSVMCMRRKLSRSGAIMIVAMVYCRSNFVRPLIFSPGILDRENTKHAQILNDISTIIKKACSSNKSKQPPAMESDVDFANHAMDFDTEENSSPEVDSISSGSGKYNRSNNKRDNNAIRDMRRIARGEIMKSVKELLINEIGKVPYIDIRIESV